MLDAVVAGFSDLIKSASVAFVVERGKVDEPDDINQDFVVRKFHFRHISFRRRGVKFSFCVFCCTHLDIGDLVLSI